MNDLLQRYATLLNTIDLWFSAMQRERPQEIVCSDGCSGCCRGLFDISLLDARLLQVGFELLPAATRTVVKGKAEFRLAELQKCWPNLAPPYLLNHMDDSAWVEMPEEDLTPCPLLGTDGRCLVYLHRPMTCRLHGLPQIDNSGEIFLGEWCSHNFIGMNPLQMEALRYDFHALFTTEFNLLRSFATQLCGLNSGEFDTFIPLALLIDYDQFPWREWVKIHPNVRHQHLEPNN